MNNFDTEMETKDNNHDLSLLDKTTKQFNLQDVKLYVENNKEEKERFQREKKEKEAQELEILKQDWSKYRDDIENKINKQIYDYCLKSNYIVVIVNNTLSGILKLKEEEEEKKMSRYEYNMIKWSLRDYVHLLYKEKGFVVEKYCLDEYGSRHGKHIEQYIVKISGWS